MAIDVVRHLLDIDAVLFLVVVRPLVVLVGGRLRLADFGLATAAVQKPGARQLTLPYERLGTPDYMAPECRGGISKADLRMDVYSLGVVIYEMLTGDLPVGRYGLPSSKCGVITEVDDVVMRCLEPDPTRRYADAGAVRQELTLVLGAMRRRKSWAGSAAAKR